MVRIRQRVFLPLRQVSNKAKFIWPNGDENEDSLLIRVFAVTRGR